MQRAHSAKCLRRDVNSEEVLSKHPCKKNASMSEYKTFCSFCVLEQHICEIVEEKLKETKFVYPMSALKLIEFTGQGLFEVGKQCDAQEFLLCLIDNLMQSSFDYAP